jgi:hypothetical protein
MSRSVSQLPYREERTRELGVFCLELIPLVCAVPRAAMDYDAECGRGCFSRLAREEAVDMIGRRLAVVKNRFRGFVCRRHNLNKTFVKEGGGERTRVTYVDVWSVDRKRAFLLSNDHRHFSVYSIFLKTTDQRWAATTAGGEFLEGTDLVRGGKVLRCVKVQVGGVGHALENRSYVTVREDVRAQDGKSFKKTHHSGRSTARKVVHPGSYAGALSA